MTNPDCEAQRTTDDEKERTCESCGYPESRHPVDVDEPGAGTQTLCTTFVPSGGEALPENWQDVDVLLEVSRRLDEMAAELGPESATSSLGSLALPIAELLGRLATIVRIERLRHRALLRTEPGGADAARLRWLERTVSNRHHDYLIQWDHEDGFWLSRVAKGTYPQPTALGRDKPARDLRAAIDFAMEETMPPSSEYEARYPVRVADVDPSLRPTAAVEEREPDAWVEGSDRQVLREKGFATVRLFTKDGQRSALAARHGFSKVPVYFGRPSAPEEEPTP